MSDSTRDILSQLANGRIPGSIPGDLECAEELECLAEYFAAIQHFTVALGNGDLTASLKGYGGPVAGGLKTLQASLRHLTWQTRQIAAGDFSQHVDFMGDFATSFNTMVANLATMRVEMNLMNARLREELVRQRKLAEELREEQERFRQITEKVNAVIWTMDLSTLRFTYVSPYVSTLRGLSVEEALAETLEEALTPESLVRFNSRVTHNTASYLATGDASVFSDLVEVEQVCRDGRKIQVEMVMSAISDSEGNLRQLVGISRDITERKAEEQQLIYRSCHDSLTGLYNRSFFDTEFERVTHGRIFPVSFIVADLDGLKEINDSLGHAMGDRFIRGAATVLRMAFREDDIIARTGGDEFVALLPGMAAREAAIMLARIRSCEQSYNNAPDGPVVSMSLGTATALRSGDMARTLADADARMYAEKAERKRLWESHPCRKWSWPVPW